MGACLSSQADAVKYQSTATATQGPGALMKGDSMAGEALNALALLTGSSAYSSWVEVHVACQGLRRGDVLSKSDAMAVLYEVLPNGQCKELGRTEVIAESSNPTFTVPFKVLYNFERVQDMLVLVIDLDKGQQPQTVKPEKCDFLGELHFKLSELITSPGKTMARALNTHSAHKSMVVLRSEELSSSKEEVTMQVSGVDMRNVELLSKSDPFLEINRSNQGDASQPGWQPVFRTEVRDNNLNPVWRPVTMKATQLHNGDVHRPLLLKVFDFNANGDHKLLGEVQTSASSLEAAAKDSSQLLLTRHNHPGKHCGALKINTYQSVVRPTFLDYIQAGTEISFMVAVDFTGSNGRPTDFNSLHYMSPTGDPTPYEQVLCAVARVLEFYDSDRMYPAFGFGGQQGNNPVSHCFPLNGRADGVCAGVEGVKQAYRQALTQWQLSGPTLFAPIIRTAAAIAAQPTQSLKFNVLLILTDGEIMDMPETVDAIVAASALPLSILVVGIGNADFGKMEQLDSDKKRLKSCTGYQAERDIVQFVEFRKYQMDADALASQLLAELPGQFLTYTRARNIPPPVAPPVPAAPAH